MEKICYGCMKQKQQSPVCEHCGFSEETNNPSYQLSMGTVLEEQYIVGRTLSQTRTEISYIGWDQRLERLVTVREYFPSGLADREPGKGVALLPTADREEYSKGMERFLQKARSLAQLQNIPGILRIYSTFQSCGTAYIVTEHPEGITLQQYMIQRSGKLTAEETLTILEPVMYSLCQVHQIGLIHGDITPENILLQKTGSVKLLGFDAVREVEEENLLRAGNSSQTFLRSGFTPIELYQSTGKRGPWSDEYAICATIYYCLTGQIPPDAPDRLLEDTQVNWQLAGGLSQRQISALRKGMALEASNRYPSLEELALELYPEDGTQPETSLPDIILLADTEEPAPQPSLVQEPSVPVKKTALRRWMLPGIVTFLMIGLTLAVLISRMAPAEEPAADTQIQMEAPTETGATEASTQPSTAPADLRSWENNVLMPSELGNDVFNEPLFGLKSDISRGNIRSVIFLDTLDGAPQKPYDNNQKQGYWDASAAQDGSVLAWLVPAHGTSKEGAVMILYDLYIGAEGGVCAPESCAGMLSGFACMSSMDLRHFHTENVKDMKGMFLYCTSLSRLDASTLDTSRVENMNGMFAYCVGLNYLDLSGWDTSNVTDMSAMFGGCTNLKQLDVSHFDTAKVENMNGMFAATQSLKKLDLSTWDTSKVADMGSMLFDTLSPESVELGSWETDSLISSKSFMSEGVQYKGKPWEELFPTETLNQTATEPTT